MYEQFLSQRAEGGMMIEREEWTLNYSEDRRVVVETEFPADWKFERSHWRSLIVQPSSAQAASEGTIDESNILQKRSKAPEHDSSARRLSIWKLAEMRMRPVQSSEQSDEGIAEARRARLCRGLERLQR